MIDAKFNQHSDKTNAMKGSILENCEMHYMGQRITTSDKFITSLIHILFESLTSSLHIPYMS
jgi:hypothetical protein